MEDRSVNEIDIDSFRRTRLRVGKVISAEPVPKSKKLLKLYVDFGDVKKTILSGISPHYSAEDVKDKKVVVVFNLKPAKMMGLESEGMILCAQDSTGNLSLLTVDRAIPEGSDIY